MILALVAITSLLTFPAMARTRAQEGVATPPAPPTDLVASDKPNDNGDAIDLEWTLSPDDNASISPRRVSNYVIYRREAEQAETAFTALSDTTYESNTFTDSGAKHGVEYVYRVTARAPNGVESTPSNSTAPFAAVRQFFDASKAWMGIILMLVGGSVIYFIETARKGKDLKIRKIAGLSAVSEAVGRATEMGRPVLFIPGIQDINDIQTIAGITILGNIAKVCAEYDAQLEVPTPRSLVMTAARETVEASYLMAGRPDAYNEDNIYYITDEQFGYVAGVTGMMVRKKPAACFYMGAFFAESLILAETGNGIGAIQIAGTAMPSQLPFFVAACDYTLIGEEFFAASAYLSGEPHQLGSLKGQDVGKLLAGVLIVIGCFLATIAIFTEGDDAIIDTTVTYLKNNILGDGGLKP
ncbi:MAG: DUF6754 domain-containing protein [Phycisphaerales bacterium]